MNKQEFRQLFLDCAHEALRFAERKVGAPLSNDFAVELHGAGRSGDIVAPDQAVDLMYLDENRFYLVIDVCVKAVRKNQPIIFVCISGHTPSTFDRTWNTPKGNGPFKVLEPIQIQIEN